MTPAQTVIGIDSSTQSCKAVVCDAETGAVLAASKVAHPDGSEVDPRHWEDALDRALRELPPELVATAAALSIGGQQHGMVVLDEAGEVIRPALLWNDLQSAPDAADLVAELGPQQWADRAGSVPSASFTVTKLRWLARREPENAARTASVLLPHDWLTHRLAEPGTEPTTDRGDASGTGYFSPADGTYDDDLITRALGHRPSLPRVAAPAAIVGRTRAGLALAAGTGDNMAAALGLGLRAGDVVVSLGTSGTVFASAEVPTADPTGVVAGFADACGRYLPLVCTLNAARVLTTTAALLGVDLAGLDALALGAAPGAGGVTLLPYLDGERTPNLPDSSGSLHGLTRASMTPQNLARAAVEGMLCGLADGVDALAATGYQVQRVLLIGGAAASAAVRAVAPDLFGVPVQCPHPGEYVALGAARQAAWASGGAAGPPSWEVGLDATPESGGSAARDASAAARKKYAQVRGSLWGA
ncbi:xylulokinase [Nakamurella sp. A5-74]|uniref:Xylulose kinase n=1 Tax=Nakamurella sp. A5-74 TaxID=3158264 RepID=A0AAU8DTM4_9ACTN